jgi:hypothetical protein
LERAEPGRGHSGTVQAVRVDSRQWLIAVLAPIGFIGA